MSGQPHRAGGTSAVLSAIRWCAGVLGAAAVAGSIIGLTAPASLHAVDRGGQPISCGTGLSPAYGRATAEDTVNRRLHEERGPLFQPSSYADDCAAVIAGRRAVGVPAAALGAVAVLTALVLGVRRSVRAPEPVDVPDAPTEPEQPPVRDVVEEAVGAINQLASPRLRKV